MVHLTEGEVEFRRMRLHLQPEDKVTTEELTAVTTMTPASWWCRQKQTVSLLTTAPLQIYVVMIQSLGVLNKSL
jgi:hypothetical protein